MVELLEKKLHILVLDEDQIVAESLSFLFESFPFVERSEVITKPALLLRHMTEYEVDLIIMEIRFTEMNGIDLLKLIHKTGKQPKVIVLSNKTDITTVRAALREGANGYISKNSTVNEIRDAMGAVMLNEEVYIGLKLRGLLIRNSLIEDRYIYSLSEREREVLHLVCEGKTIKEVAAELKLSRHTAQSYHKSVLHKFNLKRTPELIAFAIKNGLVHTR